MGMATKLPTQRGLAAVAVACALTACATLDDRSADERAADAALAHRIEATLAAEPGLYANHVQVEVRRGVVLLSGMVGDESDLRATLRTCYAIAGVRRVDDQLEIFDFIQNTGGTEGHVR